MRLKKIIAMPGLALVAALAAVLLLCQGSTLAAGKAGPVKIGVVFPLSGTEAAYGDCGLKGLKMANKRRPSVLGRPVDLILADNLSNKVGSCRETSRLVREDKVRAIIGCLTSGNTLAAASVAEKAQVPLVAPWATNSKVTRGRKYIFRVCFVDPFQGQVAAKFAREGLKAKTAAVFTDLSQEYCVGIARCFRQAFKQMGGKVVLKAFYNSGDRDFAPQLAAAKKAAPDIIYLPGHFREDALIALQARAMGLNQPILSGDAAQTDELLYLGKDAVEGLCLTTHFHPQGVETPAGKRFVAAFKKNYRYAPESISALTYDAYNVLLDAITRAGSTDPPAVAKALDETKDFPGATGMLTLLRHDAIKPVVILQVKDGKFRYLTTVRP
ncbi:MAG: ABC transporter substrate-binding protein [Desulfarculaceae bacterium]|nr:ABC transporter substrate-binding protein [Desulfarculaceae bacterium]MCF8048180.1 ABC transporter substrate-binding protein [Desulfarculaceae bacterium]MCF8065611.1 ABC transporter substrate-binding protein [Desulfarculaceae bacterium]MCF8096411.1 ABC transporter substrate-binding protein [Desulfarculaceae bacterium]MCF8121910.1 ABC transporter substrate-binding protein [Desulfarculaceae bacterium]